MYAIELKSLNTTNDDFRFGFFGYIDILGFSELMGTDKNRIKVSKAYKQIKNQIDINENTFFPLYWSKSNFGNPICTIEMGLSFENLEVWKRSCRIAVNLYRLLKECKDYGLRDQILRSAVSIASNIAEGQERNSAIEFRRFLNIAKGSAAELRTQIYIAKAIQLIPENECDKIIEELIEISKMLQGLSISLKK